MDPARWSTICDIFHTALDQSPEARVAFLRAACNGDRELIEEVGAMLANYSPACAFLEQPAVIQATDVLGLEGGAGLPYGRLFGGRYRIDQEIGRGGFGVVYRARDERLHGRLVAIKVLHEYWAASGWMRHRFEEEAKGLSCLRHPGIVSVSDFGETDESRMFLVMEWVEGPTLRDLLIRGPIERTQAAAILRAIGGALEAAHRSGLLHRDLKPENVIVGEQIKIVDFGVARVGEQAEAGGATTILAGTPEYMAPEQIAGRPCKASDIYSLALIAREMCSGSRPGQDRGKHADVENGISRRVFSLIREGLDRDPARRPQSAQVYADSLAATLLRPASAMDSIGRRSWLAGGVALCAAAAAWKIAGDFRSLDLPEGGRVVQSPGIYPEAHYGFRSAYDVQSVIVTNEDSTGRDRRRVWSADLGEYFHPLTVRQKAQAWRKGFRLSARLLPEEGLITVLVDLAGFGPRFDLVAVRGPGGETLAGTVRQVAPNHQFDLYPSETAAPRLTTIELVMNPVSKLARVFVDGKPVVADYPGHRQFQENLGLVIAVGKHQSKRASGVYQQVRLEILA